MYNENNFKKELIANNIIAMDPAVRYDMNRIKNALKQWKWIEGKHYKLFDVHKDGAIVLKWEGMEYGDAFWKVVDKIDMALKNDFDLEGDEDTREFYVERK